MAFKACEPSEAMIKALQARIGSSRLGVGAADLFPPAAPSAASSSAAPSGLFGLQSAVAEPRFSLPTAAPAASSAPRASGPPAVAELPSVPLPPASQAFRVAAEGPGPPPRPGRGGAGGPADEGADGGVGGGHAPSRPEQRVRLDPSSLDGPCGPAASSRAPARSARGSSCGSEARRQAPARGPPPRLSAPPDLAVPEGGHDVAGANAGGEGPASFTANAVGTPTSAVGSSHGPRRQARREEDGPPRQTPAGPPLGELGAPPQAAAEPESPQAERSQAGTSRPSTSGRSRPGPPHLPPTPPRSLSFGPASALERTAEQVRAARAQEELLQGKNADLEERLRQVERGQAAAMAAATGSLTEVDSARDSEQGFGQWLPSAVTVGGIPVATDGDLVYLGGGLYAAAAAPQEQQPPPRRRPRVLPGRTRVPRPLGPRSAVRSASAHLVGPQGGGPGDASPCPSRAQSDGQLGGRPDTGTSGSTAVGGRRGSDAGRERGGPRGWRPAGVQKLPPAPEPPARSGHHTPAAVSADGAVPTGAHSEARVQQRREARREAQAAGAGLFGRDGLLGQLRDGEEMLRREAPPLAGPAKGPPLNGDRRAAERKAAKEARIQQILEERNHRLEAEAAAASAARMQRGSPCSMSAPVLQPWDPEVAAKRAQDAYEQRKMRLACQMQMLDFFNAYGKPGNKLSAEQAQLLLAKLHGGGTGDMAEGAREGESEEGEGAEQGEAAEEEDEGEEEPPDDETAEQEEVSPTSWYRRNIDAMSAEPPPVSLQQRLQQVNDFCNKAFEEPDVDIAL